MQKRKLLPLRLRGGENPKGEALPEDMRLFRFDLVESFIISRNSLTTHGHFLQMIPLVIEKEKTNLRKELSQVDTRSVIFDGSTFLTHH